MMLSFRGSENARELAKPWRFSLTQTYDPMENPTGLISFGLAENRPMRAEIARYINQNVVFTQDSISYRPSAPTAARLPAAAAVHLNNILKPHAPIDPEDILVADCPTSLGSMLGHSLAESGDGILVSRPIYGRFELDYGVESGVKMVYADTTVEEAFSPACVEKYELAFKESSKNIRAVLLVNPHNPVGRCYPVETLKAITRFCNKHNLHLISDEVYASCVFNSGDPEAVPFTSILSLDLAGLIDPNLVHVLYGFSKDFASGGLHLGFLVTKNRQLRQACRTILRLHGASQAAVTIGTVILEDQAFVASFTAKARQSLASAYRFTTSVLNREGINYVKGGNAGFFVYIDLSPYLPRDDYLTPRNREFSLAERLVDAGVFLHPGEEHSRDIGWFRLVFSQEEEILQEGFNRLLSVLRSSK
ncbi:unnamed protein product [Penicillium chrysogenum] [Penicillium roqueforti FM164]|uniref:Unnamed protein product [Penicillium chrysogenum] n=2 Tax=Penicillium roqueforti TaxID=5082 RepID=W6QUU1_PENRF|nr:unnamed protein product [Penicillium chrysogenum] [Penicillium roqueforti FM164]